MKKFFLFLVAIVISEFIIAQDTTINGVSYPKPVNFTSQQNQENMMKQLGIQSLRPGPSGNELAPNHANYDTTKADPCPKLPDILTTNDGKKVTDPEMWWRVRRPQIVEDYEREVYGRIPKNVPKVTWTVKVTDREFIRRGFIPVIAKEIIGHVDNSAYPLIDVDIKMMLVVPANVKGPVPVLMMFGQPSFPSPAQPSNDDMETLNATFKEMMIKSNPEVKKIFDKYPAYTPITKTAINFFAPQTGDASPTEQLLAAGWGYCIIDPNSIQADNGDGLTKGIIGLINRGQPRKPDDWGALRAWSWGADRAMDYFETDKSVDARHVAIQGHSRYGKATIVSMAYDPRIAIAFVSSSGEGGAKLHRRNFGELVENVAGDNEYHWMAGNFLKYAGPLKWNDLPVDSHELIAMCAPRPVFLSAGNLVDPAVDIGHSDA